MTKEEPIYRILFLQQEKLYEIYTQYISEETLMGFIEAEKLIFNENESSIVDPDEERLRTEFKGVIRCYIPLHTIIRIDEISLKSGTKIHKVDDDNVSHLPYSTLKKSHFEQK